MKLRVKLLLSLLVVIAVAAMIFFFSSQDGAESSRLSGSVTQWLLTHLVPGFSSMSRAARRAFLLRWSGIVRKAAHFMEYALLGLSLTVFLHYLLRDASKRVVGLSAWGLSAFYACTDELHQCFVDSRGPAVMDVGIDSAGALVGVLAALLLLAVRHAARERRCRLTR